jgi:hypothetical protein|tara:strand:+ start:635 stop:745 length:111 start_codon:yes stop_codon:yes gene_type:complete
MNTKKKDQQIEVHILGSIAMATASSAELVAALHHAK